MKFTWDENKNLKNKVKHKISFNDATNVFYDDNAIFAEDNSAEYEEQRMKVIGMSKNKVLFVIFTELHGDEIHIISARKAEKPEIRIYNQR